MTPPPPLEFLIQAHRAETTLPHHLFATIAEQSAAYAAKQVVGLSSQKEVVG